MDGAKHVKWKVGGEETRARVLGILQSIITSRIIISIIIIINFQRDRLKLWRPVSTMHPLTRQCPLPGSELKQLFSLPHSPAAPLAPALVSL